MAKTDYEKAIDKLGRLMVERKKVARDLSQSALDVAYKGHRLNLRLVDRLNGIERQLEQVRRTIKEDELHV